MAHVPSAMRVTLSTLLPMNVCLLRSKMQIAGYRDLINVRNAMRVSTTVSYRINVWLLIPCARHQTKPMDSVCLVGVGMSYTKVSVCCHQRRSRSSKQTVSRAQRVRERHCVQNATMVSSWVRANVHLRTIWTALNLMIRMRNVWGVRSVLFSIRRWRDASTPPTERTRSAVSIRIGYVWGVSPITSCSPSSASH